MTWKDLFDRSPAGITAEDVRTALANRRGADTGERS